MSERQAGWYWAEVAASSGWECIYWNGKEWDGIEPAVVGPRIPTPDEPWQSVPLEADADMLEIQTLGYKTPASKRWRETLAAAPKP